MRVSGSDSSQWQSGIILLSCANCSCVARSSGAGKLGHLTHLANQLQERNWVRGSSQMVSS